MLNRLLALTLLVVTFLPVPVDAARLWSNGFELQSLAANMEMTLSPGSPAITNSFIRSGKASFNASSTAAVEYNSMTFLGAGPVSGSLCARSYLYIGKAPGARTWIMQLADSAGVSTGDSINLRLNTDLTLDMYDENANAAIGSPSSALSLNTWYRLNLKLTVAASLVTNAEFFIDGTSVTSGAVAGTVTTPDNLHLGAMVSATAVDMYFDDVAVNDDTGSAETGCPGEGHIVHFTPNATGTVSMGNSGPSTGLPAWQMLDETPTPNDATDYWELVTNNDAVMVDVAYNPYATTTATTTSKYYVPPGVTSLDVWGWGGGGGSGQGAGSVGGAGGGGGAFTRSTITVTPGQVIDITIGAGGTAGAPNGGAGGDTCVVDCSTFLAKGGGGATGSATGGTGGAAGSGIGDTKYSGGNGGNNSGGHASISAGGGGAAGSTGAGGNGGDTTVGVAGTAGTGTSIGGGNGGAGVGGGDGLTGTAPGGGASGAATSFNNAAAGARGEVWIVTNQPDPIGASDTVTLIQVGYRHVAETAALGSIEPLIKSAPTAATSTGTTFTHNDQTWRTNGDAAPRTYKLTSYTDPTTGVAWTPTGTNSLANMQIGADSPDAAPDMWITALWALIEYVDAATPPAAPSGRRDSIIWFD